MIKPFEIDYGKQSFIDGNYIDTKICDEIISYCNLNKHQAFEVDWKAKGEKHKKCIEYPVRAFDYHYPFKSYRDSLNECLENYFKKWPSAKEMQKPFNILETFNIQFYMPGDGFYPWHAENMGKDSRERLRHLVFMTYLTTVDDGGTEFLHQKVTTPARKGLTLIWPAYFTHMHRGQITNKPKAIVTGWYSFIDGVKEDKFYKR